MEYVRHHYFSIKFCVFLDFLVFSMFALNICIQIPFDFRIYLNKQIKTTFNLLTTIPLKSIRHYLCPIRVESYD